MGYDAYLVINVDELHILRDDPNAGKKISGAVLSHDLSQNATSFQYGTVLSVNHMDILPLILGRDVIGNSTFTRSETTIGHLKKVLNDLGYNVVKLPKKENKLKKWFKKD